MLGIERPISPRPPWKDPEIGRISPLWRMKLHYQEALVDLLRFPEAGSAAADSELAASIVDDWIATCSPSDPGHWLDSWNPYAISRRLVAWKVLAGRLDPAVLSPARRGAWGGSVFRQVEQLARNLERDLDGNHLLADAVGLLAGAALLGETAGGRFRRGGIELLRDCVERQILPDGGHVERATHYHLQVATDLSDAWILLADPAGSAGFLRDPLIRMARYARGVAHGGERMPALGDGVPGEQPSVDDVVRRIERLTGEGACAPPAGAFDLPDSGYFRFERGGESLVVDGGPVAWDRQPGHAHDDLFSFELEDDGRPFIVDSATSGYGGDPFRPYCRGAAGHSALTIDGFGSAEPWGDFRLGGRSDLLTREVWREGEEWTFDGRSRCWHDRRVVHNRWIRRSGPGLWRVEDRVESPNGARLVARVHFAPEWEVEAVPGAGFVARSGASRWSIRPFGVGVAARVARGERNPDEGWIFREFGRPLAAPVLILETVAPKGKGEPFGVDLVRERPGGGAR